MRYRKIKEDEKRLLEHLINKSTITLPQEWESKIRVIDMNDGGMGSIYISFSAQKDTKHEFDKIVSECIFKDFDGIEVIASLNVDKKGEVFELDMWKVDFTRLTYIPFEFD